MGQGLKRGAVCPLGKWPLQLNGDQTRRDRVKLLQASKTALTPSPCILNSSQPGHLASGVCPHYLAQGRGTGPKEPVADDHRCPKLTDIDLQNLPMTRRHQNVPDSLELSSTILVAVRNSRYEWCLQGVCGIFSSSSGCFHFRGRRGRRALIGIDYISMRRGKTLRLFLKKQGAQRTTSG